MKFKHSETKVSTSENVSLAVIHRGYFAGHSVAMIKWTWGLFFQNVQFDTPWKSSDVILGGVNLLYYKYHKINFKDSGSYISPN